MPFCSPVFIYDNMGIRICQAINKSTMKMIELDENLSRERIAERPKIRSNRKNRGKRFKKDKYPEKK